MSNEDRKRSALKWAAQHFVCFSRNGRWGTCVECPRTTSYDVFPEFCNKTDRGDHHLTLASLVESYERRLAEAGE